MKEHISKLADLLSEEEEEVIDGVLTREEKGDSGKEFFSHDNIPRINLLIFAYSDNGQNDEESDDETYHRGNQEDPYKRQVVSSGWDSNCEETIGEKDPFPEKSDFEYDNIELMYRLMLSMNRDNVRLVESPVTSVSYGLTGTIGL